MKGLPGTPVIRAPCHSWVWLVAHVESKAEQGSRGALGYRHTWPASRTLESAC